MQTAEIMPPNTQSVPATVSSFERSTAITPMDMLDRALSSNADPDTLGKLLALQERWEANQARKAFEEAMSAAKADIPEIKKGRKVDFTTSKGRTNYQYEDLASIMSVISPILSRHGLSVRYRTTAEPNQPIVVTCIVSHRMGHSEENTLMAGRDDSGNKNSIQQIGSTVTYLQRYTLKAALGLAAAADDDDGNAAGKKPPAPRPTISQDQVKVILQLLEETGVDTERFCKIGKIEAVPDMLASDFDEAVRMLQRRKAKMNEGAAS